ncbi:MAG: addiction module toxin RelE [Defluviitaleaceae bacterium]|nr:addiction module toxin RelE [Defluviitaleaceae bacterium]MCL2263103.1 addiction module toxin RelE [Defluviitaleaceae bacterium]
MTRQFIRSQPFEIQWHKMGLTDSDLMEFEDYLLANPNAGDRISGTGGAVKVRWVLGGNRKGKSGGSRIIYIDLVRKSHIHLLLCYPKSKQEDLTQEQKKQLKQVIEKLKGE